MFQLSNEEVLRGGTRVRKEEREKRKPRVNEVRTADTSIDYK
jgi:hypothetical protein